MTSSGNRGERLDSWKAIAEYLDRDVATVRRWEKTLGLPVRRVGGSGRSVFAYRAEVDAWLQANPLRPAEGGEPVPSPAPSRMAPLPATSWKRAVTAAVLIATLGSAISVAVLSRRPGIDQNLVLHVSSAGVVARAPDGGEVWRRPFPASRITAINPIGHSSLVVTGSRPAAYASVSHSVDRATQEALGGELMEFALDGRLRRTFSFDDEYRYAGNAYGPPWAMTAFAVDDSTGARRIAVASHHYTWDPSPVTILDEQWRRIGTFVNAGWVEGLAWVSPDRLLIAGYSDSRGGGMVALLDPARLNGQGPEPPDTRYHCEDCGPERPVRMVVMPRTEVNRAAAWRFNRALLENVPDRIIARTIELEMDAGHADVVYEFSPSLELIGASFSERYWDAHQMLEAEGKLDHGRAECPDRNGPREVLVWEPSTRWQTLTLRPDS